MLLSHALNILFLAFGDLSVAQQNIFSIGNDAVIVSFLLSIFGGASTFYECILLFCHILRSFSIRHSNI